MASPLQQKRKKAALSLVQQVSKNSEHLAEIPIKKADMSPVKDQRKVIGPIAEGTRLDLIESSSEKKQDREVAIDG